MELVAGLEDSGRDVFRFVAHEAGRLIASRVVGRWSAAFLVALKVCSRPISIIRAVGCFCEVTVMCGTARLTDGVTENITIRDLDKCQKSARINDR